METIRLGSRGDAVAKWQRIIKVDDDGIFGPVTESETKEWQRDHDLVVDGIVGPVTWSIALGTEIPKTKTPQAGTDEWAYQVSKAAMPVLSEAERQYALTVARGEGFYGRGWKGDGTGSNNWGAVQGVGSAGSFQTTDHHADGSAYVGTFKRYNSPEEGFADMARILLKDNVKGALKKGSLKDAVFAQHSNRYFELEPSKYLEAVKRNYNVLVTNLDIPKKLSEFGPWWKRLPVFSGAVIALGSGVVYGIYKLRS